ncbi:hypothetical protein VIGAN_06119800, partial [Vigna angularis var. angularis]
KIAGLRVCCWVFYLYFSLPPINCWCCCLDCWVQQQYSSISLPLFSWLSYCHRMFWVHRHLHYGCDLIGRKTKFWLYMQVVPDMHMPLLLLPDHNSS